MLFGVVAHQLRTKMAFELIDTIEADAYNFDDYTLGCAGNHIEVLKQLQALNRGKHHWYVLLEDDAVPVQEFRDQACAALQSAPSPVVSFYMGTSANVAGPVQQAFRDTTEAAFDQDLAWITSEFLSSTVGWAIHADFVDDMLRFILDREDEELPLRVTRWAQSRQIGTSYTYPSLTNHADTQSVIAPAITPQQRMLSPRKSWTFGTRNRWDTASVPLIGSFPPWTDVVVP